MLDLYAEEIIIYHNEKLIFSIKTQKRALKWDRRMDCNSSRDKVGAAMRSSQWRGSLNTEEELISLFKWICGQNIPEKWKKQYPMLPMLLSNTDVFTKVVICNMQENCYCFLACSALKSSIL